jgi:hypothetical protein
MRNPLGDTSLVTEPEPTPVFRRFPWIQLVFCLACLSMTGWMWMRYSYAWAVTPVQLSAVGDDAENSPWRLYYVAVRGHVSLHRYRGKVDKSVETVWMEPLALPRNTPALAVDFPASTLKPGPATVKGRVYVHLGSLRLFTRHRVFANASRFTAASIAGLVVGAMGCFIFGLYLRAWLRERKALASQPVRDMIA